MDRQLSEPQKHANPPHSEHRSPIWHNAKQCVQTYQILFIAHRIGILCETIGLIETHRL